MGEMEDLVVVEHDDGRFVHDEGIHSAVEGLATERVRFSDRLLVETVEGG